MNPKSEPHPDILFATLLAKGGRPTKLRNLNAIQELCREQYAEGSRDFSVATIGKLCERRGLLKARGLYNTPLADYRSLIDAWAAYAGPALPKPPKTLASEEYLSRIDDPAIRSIVQRVIAERNKLKNQLNTLKSNTTIVIDRRPVSSESGIALTLANQLTDSERNALRRAISPAFLAAQGWEEVDLGEVLAANGRTVFDPGYATAIRKVLGEKA